MTAPAPPAGARTAVATHCPYCALQCATWLETGAEVTVSGREFPTNRGGLCQKGWSAPDLLRAPDRLTTPLVRGRFLDALDPDALHPTTWQFALDLIAARLSAIQTAHGRDAVAVFGGGGLTNEKAYSLGKFARVVLGTSQIDYNGRFCMSSAAAAGNRAFGLDRGLPFPLADLAGADAVLLIGANPAETMPPSLVHLQPVAARGNLIVVDPRATPTAVFATTSAAGLHLQNTPGTDLVLLSGLLHVIVQEGLTDQTYLVERVEGFDAVAASVASWWPERTEQVTGVPAELIREAARRLAAGAPRQGGSGVYIITGRGAEQHTKGTDTVTAAINLALALGLPGRVGSGYGCLTGQGNGQGGREHGQKADQLPGYRSITDPAARRHVAAVWGVDPDSLPGPGRSAVELFAALGTPGGPKALLVHGSNPVVSAPNASVVAERLRTLDLLVVCDLVPSETALLADVVLPVTQWAEEDGTMTTLEGRVVRRRAAIPAPPGVRTELEILADLATRLGHPSAINADPATVFAELARASAGGPADYSGITYQRLDTDEALHWPCAPDSTPRVFLDRFHTPTGRARAVPVTHRPPGDDLRADADLYLITGRLTEHYQSGAQTRRVPRLLRAAPEPLAEIHPDLAARFDLDDGDLVTLTTRRGQVRTAIRITASIRPDCVFLPFHFAGAASANLLTHDGLDPLSKMPEFRVCAVRMDAERMDAEQRDIS